MENEKVLNRKSFGSLQVIPTPILPENKKLITVILHNFFLEMGTKQNFVKSIYKSRDNTDFDR